MLNPCYLIKSRHDVYYFRYPLTFNRLTVNKRVSVSLKTRCPKEALRLAKVLEYHSATLIAQLDWELMGHAEIMHIMKTYYAEVLERAKANIDENGQLPKQNILTLQNSLAEWEEVIDGDADDLPQLIGAEYEEPENDPLKNDLQKIMAHNGLVFAPKTKEYDMLKKAYKHVKRNYIKDLLAYNSSVTDFSFLDKAANASNQVINIKPSHKLGTVIEGYLKEIKSGLSERSYVEQSDCLSYLTDWLGHDFLIAKINDSHAREVKGLLIVTPKGRNKDKLTKNHPISEQIALAEMHNLDVLGNVSINKYLGYFKAFFKWAKKNRYITENVFDGIGVKTEKKKNRRRSNFTKEEVKQIIEGLGDEKPNDLTKNSSNYWGALIAVYTGARRNEIAALLPSDVKQDTVTGIWYFDITDEEEEGKNLKTEASRRIVPIHSKMIELGFLEFVKESSRIKGRKDKNGYELRLLYNLTYTNNEKWGRNLGRWFNEKYLTALGLKTTKKTLHSLRHSFITFLSAAGVEGATTKSLVGHEPDTVTTQVYTHYGVEHLPLFREAIEKLPY